MTNKKLFEFSSDYVRERFSKSQVNGEAVVKCPFGQLTAATQQHLQKLGYVVKLLSETTRETVYRIKLVS